MGRRSTKTTKTGKFMNPTDQWRKQCRKKELKKNRVQRTAVREAVIKSKNPQQLLAEIEEIEKMEIEAGTEDLPNDKGLKEKKRKLHETLQRIVNFYEREDYNKAQQIKTFIVESEKRRRDMTTVYSSYRTARSQYDVSDIPLPEGSGLDDDDDVTADIPLPDEPLSTVPKALLPPGPPPGPPPDVMYPKAITMRPKRAVHFTADSDDGSDGGDSSDSGEDNEDDGSEDSNEEGNSQDVKEKASAPKHSVPIPSRPPGPPPGFPPPGIRYPPPLFPPPQAPIGRYPIVSPVPPIPLMMHSGSSKPSPHFQSSAVISATPVADPLKQPMATITARPQIRNVQAEVTKFLPTSLRVRRDNPRHVKVGAHSMDKGAKPKESRTSNPQSSVNNPHSNVSLTKGDAYDAFMKEMQGLI